MSPDGGPPRRLERDAGVARASAKEVARRLYVRVRLRMAIGGGAPAAEEGARPIMTSTMRADSFRTSPQNRMLPHSYGRTANSPALRGWRNDANGCAENP